MTKGEKQEQTEQKSKKNIFNIYYGSCWVLELHKTWEEDCAN